MDNGDAFTAELWGCLHGLKVEWDEGHRRVILESDASSVIELLSTEPNEDNADYTLLQEIRSLIDRSWEVRLSYAPRACNAAADHLAKFGLGGLLGFHMVYEPHYALAELLAIDCRMTKGNHVGVS
ncbi:uncharacterized protein LOC114736815 [Neltuma alba]|uniref:uncharacterized protein LOC114736815 n=1 Tax=Neltuma alba TaxID=207710 RepID=UPI0010A4BA7E|nr:uncharacterized protein LOC114736815 [Prosopis alba]